MNVDQLKRLVLEIVEEARRLNAKHTDEPQVPVNYACIFTQSPAEYKGMTASAGKLGSVCHDTSTGPVFFIAPLPTAAGDLRLIKIRRQDPKRTERGDADFTVADYPRFKEKHLGRPGFNLIERPEMEMIELIDPAYNVLAYYSHPTLIKVLGLAPRV
jgi:hypothetical protein